MRALIMTMAAVLVGAGLAGCDQGDQSTKELDPDKLTWTVYEDTSLGYSLFHPDTFSPEPEAGSVLFRFQGVPVLVRHTDEKQGRKTGAWFGNEPMENITLDSYTGEKFIYHHCEGPFCTRTIAYVIEHGDRYLGLEFRTRGDLDPVQERVLASFRVP